MLLEVIATSIDDVRRAVSGGADRIELCTGLKEGGMTPSLGLIEAAVQASSVPLHVLIRPHSLSYFYEEDDIRVMIRDIRHAKLAGAAGIVIGALTRENRVDEKTLRILLDEAGGLNVTFHRAFDEARDLDEALEALLAFPQVSRILTSGGKPSILEAIGTIAELQRKTRGTAITILAGAGLTVPGYSEFVRRTSVTEVHFGRGVRVNSSTEGPVDPELVRTVKGYEPT
ncbi:copper homeostasis protein CutC [Cohnella cholangitidis]|uniref:PF03932 family protein CutC n=1 Tax=Cohnella cholangitidis TaxID=2598458 RepID=A0A7G5C1E4_9BACL|nr:copper homeostasis protein CutC [Cohnella cholangitidis]QMV43028.1 copper homeostasis protein CutC [Cohnella cholangitidis]